MSELSYNIKADITPARAKSGDKVTITAHISALAGEIYGVYVSVPMYGVNEKLRKIDEGTYSLDYLIPWEAYSETYEVKLYAMDKSYNRGPSVTISYTVY